MIPRNRNKVSSPIFSTNDKEKTGKKSKNTFKRGSSLVSGLMPGNSSENKKGKDPVKNENKVKTKSKIIKTKRRNSVPPDKEDKGVERKLGVSQMMKNLPSPLLSADRYQTGPKKNSISEFVQNNLLDKMRIPGDNHRRSHSLDELNTLRKCFLTAFGSDRRPICARQTDRQTL